ncbi:MAG: SiaB family protein kinase [bacterium]
MRYSVEKVDKKIDKRKIGKGMVMICENKENIALTASNVIKNGNTKFLKKLCDTINTTDKKGLKQFYKNNLHNKYIKNRYNANIGLIHIVRKTEHPLDYSINKINDKNSLFTVSVTVDKGEKGNYFKFQLKD